MTRKGDDVGDIEAGPKPPVGNGVLPVRPSLNQSRPIFFLMAVVVAVIIAVGTFTAVAMLTRNSDYIEQSCLRRNEAISTFNERFAQLTHLFDVVLANRDPGEPPPADEVVRLLEEFKVPVPLTSCDNLKVKL